MLLKTTLSLWEPIETNQLWFWMSLGLILVLLLCPGCFCTSFFWYVADSVDGCWGLGHWRWQRTVTISYSLLLKAYALYYSQLQCIMLKSASSWPPYSGQKMALELYLREVYLWASEIGHKAPFSTSSQRYLLLQKIPIQEFLKLKTLIFQINMSKWLGQAKHKTNINSQET